MTSTGAAVLLKLSSLGVNPGGDRGRLEAVTSAFKMRGWKGARERVGGLVQLLGQAGA